LNLQLLQKRKYTCDIMRVIQFGDIEDTVHVCPKELSSPRKYKNSSGDEITN